MRNAGPCTSPRLIAYLDEHHHELCDEHREHYLSNPLRVLDCKRPQCRAVTEGAPRITDYLDEACAAHLARVRQGLDELSVSYRMDPRLVRGLDYYTRTTFEFSAGSLTSAQNAVGGGGRYDGLAQSLGGPPTPGIGFGIGIERLLLACDAEGVFPVDPPVPDVFVVDVTGGTAARALCAELRRAGLGAVRADDGRSLKAQLKQADRSGARHALIVGPEELAGEVVTARPLREQGPQETVARASVVQWVAARLEDVRHQGRHVKATGMRTHLCGELRPEHIDRRVTLCGWVGRRRQHGEHLSFVDLRDFSGIVQCVVDGSVDVRSEWVVRVEGTVRRRPEGTDNPELPTGEVELTECAVEVLSQAEPPPFPVDDRAEVDESVRLRYRFVDLRRPRMQRNLRLRGRVLSAMRAAMVRQGFCEVETPLLWTPTPEGAREFAVPSRLNHGKFYVLPQSPQIAKQLLMVAGMDRYFQVARCLRDEDLRADRQFEFTQLDIEASFVTERDVQDAVTVAIADATEAAVGEPPSAIEYMTWHEAMERFGVDKPDVRFGMELVDLGEVFAATAVRALGAPCVKAVRVPGGGALGRNRLDSLVERAKELGAQGLAWFKVDSDAPVVLTSPLDKVLSAAERSGLVARTGAVAGDLVMVVADQWRTVCEVLGQLRLDLGGPPVGQGERRFVWVTEFPLFDGIDEDGNPRAAHHPFTMPHPDDIDLMLSDPRRVPLPGL